MPERTAKRCLLPALTLAAVMLCSPGTLISAPPDVARVAADPLQPIVLGPRGDVGKESLGDKAAKNVLGALVGGSKRGDKGPRTRKDPTRKQDYTVQERPEAELEVGARAAWTDDGLLVSSLIEESGEKGTFHAIFLQDCAGRRRYPASIEIYEIWSEASISVSWSQTTTVDGRVVGSESGGWGNSWSDEWTVPGTADGAVEGPPGIWQQVGYGRAHGGVRQVGAYFSVAPEDFADCDPGAYVHVSRPEQDPVVTVPVAFTLDSEGGGGPVVVTAGHTIATLPPGAVATAPPCQEALLQIEQKRSAMLAQLDDPARLLAAALQAAADLGHATRAQGEAEAHLAAEHALLTNLQGFLKAWDQWFQERLEQREQRRQERHGSREPSWANGSRARAERRHQEDTAGLRQQVAEQQQKVQAAEQAAAAAAQAREAAQARFDRALDEFARALAALRNAKDAFAELVVKHYRCSPCEAIASHWQSAARLQELLDRLAAMLTQRQATVAAALASAQQRAAAAAQDAQQAQARLGELQGRRGEIEQELRDAVDTSNGCLSLEPVAGAGWMNLASMDQTRGTVVSEGAVMAWRSRFKGSDVRVWVKPGCLESQIEEIDWNKVNELNRELADLRAKLDQATAEAAEAQRAAAIAQAAVAGLQAEKDALDRLERALRDSGLGQNTDEVLQRLDELSEDCEQAMKDAIRGAADARRRQGDANGRIAGASAKKDALRKRAGEAADELDDMDPSAGTDEDRDRHGGLSGKADELGGGEDDDGGRPPPKPVEQPPPPETLDDAEKQREDAERDADAAEAEADDLESEVDELEDEVEDLEDDVDELGDRLRAWRDYYAALARYEDCLRKKQQAIEELAELNSEHASALQELARRLGEAADGLADAAGPAGDLGRVNEDVAEAAEKAEQLADALDRLGNALEVIDAVMRADELTPSEKLEAMSKAFEELREWLPELPGVSEMLEFYNEAMKAIAGKLKEIEDAQIKQWAELVEAGLADPEDAPIGIREEVRKAARIRELMKIITRNCGKPPAPPSAAVMYDSR